MAIDAIPRIRCPHKTFGLLISGEGQFEIEVKCDSRLCGAHRGIVVLHRFILHNETARLIDTLKYKVPNLSNDERKT